MESYVGKTLGNRYEVSELLGEGGMAVVYKAFDPMENRVVAIKILKEEFLANEEFRRRFKNESKAIAILSHPNIVKVYDVFFSENLQYIVMEYIEGITLKDYIKQQKIVGWKEAVHFTTQILRALQHAHDKGIVHRDIKPQNIMVLQNGNIKVADFGIARFSRGETTTITENGAIGSVHYISPEQARGELTDAQADIYSVGVVLYEMITGRLPFDSESAVSVALMQVQSEPVRPRDINPMIPIGLEQITIHAMQKDKTNRYQTASEMLLDLDEFKRNPSMKFDYGFTTIAQNSPVYQREPAQYVPVARRESYDRQPQTPNYRDPYHAAPQENYETPVESGEDDEDAEEEDNRKNVLLPVLIGVFAALVVGIVLLGVFVIGPRLSGDTVKMPNLVGQEYEAVLEQYPDLNFADPVYVYSNEYAVGVVCDQSVDPGEQISADTSIRLSVASDEGESVENVVGMQYSEAQQILKSYGFVVSIVPEESATAKEGEVIRMDPAANSVVQSGSTITLYVALADNSPVAVPNLLGKTEEEARQLLEDVGLVVGNVTEDTGTSSDEGTVLRQTPEAEQEVARGSSVDFVISSGEEEQKTVSIRINMPSASGATARASAYINGILTYETSVRLDGNAMSFDFSGRGSDNEFTIYIESFLLAAGTIDFSANPASYEVQQNNAADYVVEKAVPDVRNLSLSNARQILDNEGFTNISVLEQETDSYTPGTIISQSPSDDATYPLDSRITLVVAKAPVTEEPQPANDDNPEE